MPSPRPTLVTAAVMALAGAALVLWPGTGGRPRRAGTPGARPAATAPAPGGAAHGPTPPAAGAPEGAPGPSPEVAARFAERVAALEARGAAAPGDRDALLELARLLHDGHRVRDALPRYRQAIALDPDDPGPYYDLASAHASLGAWDNARAVLEERLARAPGDGVALYDLGVIEVQAGDGAAAARRWRRAQEVATDPDLRRRVEVALARLAAEGRGGA